LGDAIKVLSPNNLGDLSLHLTYIRYLANGAAFWPDNPIFASGPLTYPVGIDLFDSLLKLIGVEAVSKYLNELGINEMVIANSEKEIGKDWETQYRNWASPQGALQLLRSLHERRGLSEQSQQLLLKFMIETPRGPNRLKGLLPKTTVVAHKPGTGGASRRVASATNDIGLITLPNGQHLAIAVFVSDSHADMVTRERVIAEIAKAVYENFSP